MQVFTESFNMNKNQGSIHYIEKLTIISWLFSVFPYFRKRSKEISPSTVNSSEEPSLLLYYVDASPLGLLLSRFMAGSIKAVIKPLIFRFFDVQDKNGDRICWITFYRDLVDIQKRIIGCPEFQEIVGKHKIENKMLHFLMRRVLYCNLKPDMLWRVLLLIRMTVAEQKCNTGTPMAVFFLSSRGSWLSEVKKWAEKENVLVVPVNAGVNFNIQEIVLQVGFIKSFLKQVMYYWMTIKYYIRGKKPSEEANYIDDIASNAPGSDSAKSLPPKMAVEYYGQCNLFSPQLQSDLFFSQQSNISKQDILIYFQHKNHPLTDEIWSEIKKNGMSASVINSRATVTPHVPVFKHSNQENRFKYSENIKNSNAIQKDLYGQINDYYKQYDYWADFVTRHNIKMHVAWFKHESEYLPIMDVMQKTGGVGVLYQRSFENLPNPFTTAVADVVFGFSQQGAHLGKDLVSVAPYYVITGYLGDHRFSLLQKEADDIRNRLKRHGAKKIITYFDENTTSKDARWGIGHEETQKNYAYLLKKVLETRELGLILKPKFTFNLRERLGGVAELLRAAEETDRCYISEDGDIIGKYPSAKYPPAIGALASDIAIHGHLFAGTAGLESALTGTPTLMLDREGCSFSPLYKLGLGRVIFQNWDDLWKACQDHWKSSDGVPGFGDWSPLMDDLDPFRDGRAAQRMGTYLEWLMKGFKEGLPREMILADAAQRYSDAWGKDKILSINLPGIEKDSYQNCLS